MTPSPELNADSGPSPSSAGQQFIAASAALVTAVDRSAEHVKQLKDHHATTVSSVRTLSDQVIAVDERIKTLERKPEDNTKWMQLAISVIALIVSLVSAGFSIKFSNDSAKLSERTSALETRANKVTGQEQILTILTEMASLERRAQGPFGATTDPNYLSVREQYDADANKVDIYRRANDFTEIDAKNFSRLMRTVLSFQDLAHARSFWESLTSVKADDLEDRMEIALVDADYARVAKDKEEAMRASTRLRNALQESALKPSQKINAHLALAEMFATVLPNDSKAIGTARTELTAAQDVLGKQRKVEPDYGRDLDARTKDLGDLIAKLETAEKARIQAAKKPQNNVNP
jgi:hypothetical protein